MPVSFFDASIVGGHTDPNVPTATPGCLLRATTTGAAAGGTFTAVAANAANQRISQRVPPSYVSGTDDTFLTSLAYAQLTTRTTRAYLGTDDETLDLTAGPEFTDASESGIGFAVQDASGEVSFFRISDLGDTTEPYESSGYVATGAADLTTGAATVVVVDTSHANVDWDNLQFESATPSEDHSVAAGPADWSFETPQPSVTYGLSDARRSLFDAAATGPGDDGDIGLRWVEPFTAFATEPNGTRAHLIANNQMAGGVTPDRFDDPAGNPRRIDWLVLHHGNDFVILNLDANLTDITQADYRVAFRDRATGTVWTYSARLDANEADPYEVPATQADLDAIVAVISGGGTLDAIIYDDDTAGNLAGWNANTLTYDAPPMHMVDAGDAAWSFATTEPTVTKTLAPTLFLVDDGGNALWRLPDPASPGDAVLVGNLPSGFNNPKGLASYGGVLYGVDDSGDELWVIDIDDPSNSTRVGELPPLLESPNGLFVQDGVLFCVDGNNDELWRVDTVNPGNSVRIGGFPSGLSTPDGAAYHDGAVYCCDSSSGADLWRIDTEFPGNSTEVGNFPSGIRWPNGLASHGGNLYCIDNDGDELWIVDTTTPSASTEVGNLPAGLGVPRGITSHEVPAPGTTSITVDLGDDQMVRGDLDYVLPATVTINNPVGVPVYLWERVSGVPLVSIDDVGRLHPVVHTPDVTVATAITYRLTVTNNGVSASDTITLNLFAHLRPPAYPTPTGPSQTWQVGTTVNLSIPIPNGNPTPTLTADLPGELSFAGLGQIQGNLLESGSGTIVITATNSEGTDTYSFDYTITGYPPRDAGDVSWEFDIPELSITENQDHVVNAGDAAWTFLAPEPTVTHDRPTIYVADTTGDELWRVDDPTDPSSGTLVGAFPEDLGSPQGLEFHNGVLYCLNASILWRLDHENPANSVEIGAIPVDSNQSPQGLASHDGILYCVVLSIFNRVEELWVVDVDNPADSVLIGTLPAAKQAPGGLASHNGVLYCVDSDSPDSLWEIDPTNPAASTRVGTFPADLDSPQGLTSHGGTLYCADLQGDQLWEIDPADPIASTLLGTFPTTLEAPRGMAGYVPRNQNLPGAALWSFVIGRPSVTRTQAHNVNAGDVVWVFLLPEASVTHNREHVVNAGDAGWTFAVTEPTVSRGERTHTVNAGDVAWTFALPEPSVTRAARTHNVNAGDVVWLFLVPEASVTHNREHVVNAGDAGWAFALPQPTATHTTPAPDDFTVNAGDVAWSFAVTEASVTHNRNHVVNVGDVGWSFALPRPTVTRTRPHAVNAGDVVWVFLLPEPSVTHVPRASQAHNADAGDAGWTFAVPQPSVTHTARTTVDHAVNAGDAAWTFAVLQPTATHTMPDAHAVDAGDAAWEFETPQPTVTVVRGPGVVSWSFVVGAPSVRLVLFAPPPPAPVDVRAVRDGRNIVLSWARGTI